MENSDLIKTVTARSDINLYRASLLYLRQEDISLQKASLNDDNYEVVYSTAKYRSPARAAGRAIGIIDQIAPEENKTIKVSEVNAGLGMYSAEVSREIFNRYKSNPSILEKYIRTNGFKFDEDNYKFNPAVRYPAIFNDMGPELISQIGGPDGFFFGT